MKKLTLAQMQALLAAAMDVRSERNAALDAAKEKLIDGINHAITHRSRRVQHRTSVADASKALRPSETRPAAPSREAGR